MIYLLVSVWSPYPMTEEDKEPQKRARRKPFGHQEARELVSELYLFGHEEDRDVAESTKTLALFDFFTLTDVSFVLIFSVLFVIVSEISPILSTSPVSVSVSHI